MMTITKSPRSFSDAQKPESWSCNYVTISICKYKDNAKTQLWTDPITDPYKMESDFMQSEYLNSSTFMIHPTSVMFYLTNFCFRAMMPILFVFMQSRKLSFDHVYFPTGPLHSKVFSALKSFSFSFFLYISKKIFNLEFLRVCVCLLLISVTTFLIIIVRRCLRVFSYRTYLENHC